MALHVPEIVIQGINLMLWINGCIPMEIDVQGVHKWA